MHELPIWNIRQQQGNTRANCDHWHHLSVHKALAYLKGQLCRLEEKAESAKMGMRSPETDTCMVPFFILGNLEEQHDGASEPYIKSQSSPTTTAPVTSRNTRSLTAPSFKRTRTRGLHGHHGELHVLTKRQKGEGTEEARAQKQEMMVSLLSSSKQHTSMQATSTPQCDSVVVLPSSVWMPQRWHLAPWTLALDRRCHG